MWVFVTRKIWLFIWFVFGYNGLPSGVAPLAELNDGNVMPRFGLGTWLGFDRKGPLPGEVQNAVEAAIEAGYRLIDTASIYKTEEQVGLAINNKINEGIINRDEIFITTKLWNDAHSRDSVVPALKDSLRNLSLDYVDLYLIHFPFVTDINGSPTNKPDIDYLETWQGMIEAKKLGLTRSIGMSNFNITQLQRLIDNSGVTPAVLQVEVNLNQQEPAIREFCKTNNIKVMGYTPFGSIFYERAAPDAPSPRIDDENLVNIAMKHNKTVPQIVLRYLFELGVTPIPKSVHKERTCGAEYRHFRFFNLHKKRRISSKAMMLIIELMTFHYGKTLLIIHFRNLCKLHYLII